MIRCIKAVYRKTISMIDFVFYKLFQLMGVKENYIVLESEGDFTDNIRAFYDYILENNLNQRYRLIWIVHNPNRYKKMYNVKFISRFHHGIHIKAMYYNAVAKWFVGSHALWPKRWTEPQIVIHTTHSVAVLKYLPSVNRKCCDYVLCCSEYSVLLKKKVYCLDDNRFLIIGMPRLDLLYQHKDCLSILYDDSIGDKLILSMQTFKQAKNWVDSDRIDSYALNIISSKEELIILDEFLIRNNCIMLVKIHHLQDMRFIDSVDLKKIRYITDDDLLARDIQVNQLLENADILLTDYSSVFYDFLLLDRPIGFLIGDISDYSRGFEMDDPLSAMPGEKINSLSELEGFINDCLTGRDAWRDERMRIRNTVYKYFDSNNCERLMNFIEGKNS